MRLARTINGWLINMITEWSQNDRRIVDLSWHKSQNSLLRKQPQRLKALLRDFVSNLASCFCFSLEQQSNRAIKSLGILTPKVSIGTFCLSLASFPLQCPAKAQWFSVNSHCKIEIQQSPGGINIHGTARATRPKRWLFSEQPPCIPWWYACTYGAFIHVRRYIFWIYVYHECVHVHTYIYICINIVYITHVVVLDIP
jgi:hypothetical protein